MHLIFALGRYLSKYFYVFSPIGIYQHQHQKLETGNAGNECQRFFETEYRKINPVLGSQGLSNIWETTNIPKLVKTGNAGILTVC